MFRWRIEEEYRGEQACRLLSTPGLIIRQIKISQKLIILLEIIHKKRKKKKKKIGQDHCWTIVSFKRRLPLSNFMLKATTITIRYFRLIILLFLHSHRRIFSQLAKKNLRIMMNTNSGWSVNSSIFPGKICLKG